MKKIIGIDIGTSAIKLAGFMEDETLFGTSFENGGNKETTVYKALDHFVKEYNLEHKDISRILLTGVGASFVEEDLYGIPTVKVSEMEAIGYGGLKLTGLKEALVVSMGTGTAFVRASKDQMTHIGGTGVGGGTLSGLASVLLGEEDLNKILSLAAQGNVLNVDLVIKDISKDIIPTLPFDLTASNLAKLKPGGNREDIAIGLLNMIYQVVGMLSVFACRNDTIKDVVVVGTLAAINQGKAVFERIGQLFGLKFYLPEKAPYAVAVGAVTAYQMKTAVSVRI
jgi:type II pantothenate kinase